MMPNSCILAPSILSADFLHLGEAIAACERAGASWIHVDVMDGRFVPNLTMGPVIVEACRRGTALPLDVHLMVETPDSLLESFARAGASTLTVHIETCPHIHRTVQQIHQLGCHAGVALNPGTPASALEAILPQIDLVLAMTVNPGFSGQDFLPEVLPKLSRLRAMLDEANPSARLEVDGGVSSKTLPQLRERGADTFVAGSAVFNHPRGIAVAIDELKRAC